MFSNFYCTTNICITGDRLLEYDERKRQISMHDPEESE